MQKTLPKRKNSHSFKQTIPYQLFTLSITGAFVLSIAGAFALSIAGAFVLSVTQQ
jgi:hypothetical protein